MAWSSPSYPIWPGIAKLCAARLAACFAIAAIIQAAAIAQVNYVWNSGDLVSGAITPSPIPANTVLAGDTLTLATGGSHDLAGLALTNQGTITWNSGYIRGGNGSTFINAAGATFNDLNSSGYTLHNPGWGGSFVFTNNGTYVRNTTNTTYFDIPFDNNGSLNLLQGDIQFRAGGTLASTGSIAAASGTNVYFTNSYTIAGGSSLSGAGTYRLTGGTLTTSGTINVGAFVQTGGELRGTTTLVGAYSWHGGDWNGANVTIAPSTGVLTLGNGANHDLNGGTILNQGTVTWHNGYIRGGSGASFTNAVGATFNDLNASGYTLHNPGWGGSFTFTNNGSYVRNTTDTTYFDVPFNNNGTVSLLQGNIQFRAGGTLATGGSISAASGTNVYFANSYTIADGSSLSGAGTFRLTNGTLTTSGTIDVGTFVQTGGELRGTTTLVGAYSWHGGDWNGANVTIAPSTGVLTLGNGANHDLNGGTIFNQGTVTWHNGYIRGGSGATFTNAAGATFNDLNASSYTVHNPGWGGSFTFTNNGTYVRDAAGTTYFDVPFNNNGTVSLLQGDIQFRAGGTLASTGSIAAASGTNVYFTNSYTIANGSSLGGAGTFRLTNGTLTASGTIDVGTFVQTGGELRGTTTLVGAYSWHGGDWNGANVTIAPSTGVLTLGNGANHDLNGGTILNQGTVTWHNGYIRGGSGATFTNAAGATFNDLNASGYTVHNPGWGGSFTFTNNGTYIRDAAGTTRFDVPFVNGGSLSLRQGQLNLNSTTTLQASGTIAFTLSGPTAATDFGVLNVTNTLILAGLLQVTFADGYEALATPASTFTLANAGAISGAFTNVANGGTLLTSDGLGLFTVNYGAGSLFAANSLVLSNFAPVPEPSTLALLALGAAAVFLFRRRR